jgi:hypothetical protein
VNDNYQWYLQSCSARGIRPLSKRRFTICMQAWLNGHEEYDALDLLALPHRQRLRLMRRWCRLNRLAVLTDAGRGKMTKGRVTELPPLLPPETAASSEGGPLLPPEIDSGGHDGPPGAREPLRPIAPLLAGSGARPIPRPDRIPEPRWHVI